MQPLKAKDWQYYRR